MELMVVTAVISGLLTALFITVLTGRNSQQASSATLYVQSEARRAIDVMVGELREGGRIRQAGDPVGNVSFTDQTQMDFQIARGYDSAACEGTCWGDETSTGRWLHYLLNPANPQNVQLLRCSTANQADAVDLATCRVLANHVQTFQVDYNHAELRLNLRLEVKQLSNHLPGGGAAVTPTPLLSQVTVRNSGA